MTRHSFKEQMAAIRGSFNRQLALSIGLIAISQFNFGFDQTAYSTTQAMTHFDRTFGEYDPARKQYIIGTRNLSFLNSLPYIGFVVGLLVGSEISARFGRRMVMFVMSIYALCTAAITVSSMHFEQILVARILNYGYVGMELAVVPIFQSEIVPKKVRGIIVETYQLMLYFGGLIMSIICFGTQNINDNRQWRIPFGLFFIIPTIVSACIWFIPESPRWLLLKGRHEEAAASLHKLRAGRFTDAEIAAELDDMRAILSVEREQGTFMELWKPANLKRTMIVVGVNFFLQLTGNIFASKYGAVYIKSLGTVNPFVMTMINQLVNLGAVVVSMAVVDRLGRRPLLMIGSSIQLSALFSMAALGVVPQTNGTKTGIVALLTVFGFGFSIGWAPVSHILSAELPSTRLRDMTYRTASAVNIMVQFATAFSIPYLLDALDSKVGFVFGTAAVLALLFSFFCVPECNHRTLEEIDQMFLDGTPIRKFHKVETVIIRDVEGHGHVAGDVVDPDAKPTAVQKEYDV